MNMYTNIYIAETALSVTHIVLIMDSLPLELLWQILSWDIRMCRYEKNTILPMRLVCHAFDTALKPYIFKTIQLEFSRFLKSNSAYRLDKGMDFDRLRSVGSLTEALYLDLMVVRDPEEIEKLDNVFHGVIDRLPEMGPLLGSLGRYCMGAASFDEEDFRSVLEKVLLWTPNMHRVKLNLPFQVVGQKSRTATLLLATTLECLAKRGLEHQGLQTLVVDHLSDTSLIDICNNPMDLANAITVFTSILELCVSIKRQESDTNRQESFNRHLWFLFHKASALRSLCLVGWNVKRDIRTRRHCHGVTANLWNMRSLPFSISDTSWDFLRYLELKRVDILPLRFLELMKHVKNSLKELYLVEVYLKIRHLQDGEVTGLWIGKTKTKKPESSIWLAEELRNMEGLRLNILRATGLGYDEFTLDMSLTNSCLDLVDPLKLDRSFDLRFVDAVTLGSDQTALKSYSDNESSLIHSISTIKDLGNVDLVKTSTSQFEKRERYYSNPRKRKDYDAETYQLSRNTTSYFKRCIDGWFFNHNEQALRELQGIVTVADRGMTMLSNEIHRARYDDGDF
ncbi:hypothetical protein Golomagni_00121 [Golovinomyces magnicellulatus]|nr:hypothetical protein Golomagni_00121 [Golovinomyces magnicellulatus]